MVAYGRYADGQMSDEIPTDDNIAAGLSRIPNVPLA